MRRTSRYEAKERYRGSIAREYAQRRSRDREWDQENAAMSAMLGSVPAGSTVLDVPFGTGRFADLYLGRRDRVIGADISRDMLAAAQASSAVAELGPLFVQADAERLPLRDTAVDYVVCARLFNWLPADVRPNVLRELARVAGRGVLLQVRVREDTSLLQFCGRLLRATAREPVGAFAGRARGLVRRARLRLNRLRIGMDRIGETQHRNVSSPIGYTVLDEQELNALLEAAGLAIERTVAVHANFHLRRHVVFQMRLYRLGRTG